MKPRRSSLLKRARLDAGLSQMDAAARLGVSQPYLSLLEAGKRAVSARVATAATRVYSLSATFLPVVPESRRAPRNSDKLVRDVAALGYPGYEHVRWGARVNPAAVVLEAASRDEVDSRVTQALPWVVARYPDLDWDWLLDQVKLRNAQNRLGFVVSLARELSERYGNQDAMDQLAKPERELERSRLLAETTLGRESMSPPERSWVRANRSPEAERWNVLTTLTADQVRYAP